MAALGAAGLGLVGGWMSILVYGDKPSGVPAAAWLGLIGTWAALAMEAHAFGGRGAVTTLAGAGALGAVVHHEWRRRLQAGVEHRERTQR